MYSLAGLGVYIRNTMPNSDPGLSGWGYTDFHASVNFAFWGFCEVRIHGVLRSSDASLVLWSTYTPLTKEYAALVTGERNLA
jgi:hypothetical protein